MNHTSSKMHRLSFFCFVALTATLVGCGIQGSGQPVTEERELEDFRSVHVQAGLRAEVRTGPHSVVVTGDDNIVPHISTTVVGGVLHVEPEASFEEDVPLVITISAPLFEEVSLEAGGRIEVIDVVQEELSLACRAGGDVIASGDVEHLNVAQESGGNIDATAISAPVVTLHGSAGGDVQVTATDSVRGSVESGSIARVHGSPEVRSIKSQSGGKVVWVD